MGSSGGQSGGGGGGGVTDGDKGDIVVSGGGTSWAIDDDTVTPAKLGPGAKKGVAGGLAATDVDGDVVDAAGNKVLPLDESEIGDLPDNATLDGTEQVPADQAGTTVRVTLDEIRQLAGALAGDSLAVTLPGGTAELADPDGRVKLVVTREGEAEPRLTVGDGIFGAGIGMGDGAVAADTGLTRTGVGIMSLLNGGLVGVGKGITFAEQADPPAPSADKAILFARDDGAGKTQLCVRFATGAVQVLATEP